ncbi:MAG TPA: sulfide/dihydroorotate dehydrogenase-like FAD/NAD-binding protein [Phycisphaerae bacterium]|nr:sulfide/dihydroorotate dehydrogenase-like FAD/NAD-binding protein [Phycisphaerae bacterium]
MNRILDAKWLASDVKWFHLQAPLVARHRQPGQFVIVRVQETGERIPLTVADSNAESGTIDLIVKVVGKTTTLLCTKEAGDTIADIAGPLGRPTEICSDARVIVIGGGVGTAVIYPLARALRDARCHVTAIIGGRNRELIVLESELAEVADEVQPCTDDGSYGFRGTVADRLRELIDRANTPFDMIYAAGPVPMMRAVAELTREAGIKTVVSLNPIMVDGTGMCGGCRVNVGGEVRYACVDGPEFDAHDVDYESLSNRLTAYRTQEQVATESLQHRCRAESTLENMDQAKCH